MNNEELATIKRLIEEVESLKAQISSMKADEQSQTERNRNAIVYRNGICQVIDAPSEKAFRVYWTIDDEKIRKDDYVTQVRCKNDAIAIADAVKSISDMWTSSNSFDTRMVSKCIQNIAAAVRNSAKKHGSGVSSNGGAK